MSEGLVATTVEPLPKWGGGADAAKGDGPAVAGAVETFTANAVPLLIEYHQKFVTVLERLQAFADKSAYDKYYYASRNDAIQAEAAAVDEWYKRIAPASRRLAREVSGMIDQGRIPALEKAELQLRLAEFEAALEAFPRLLAAYRKLSN